MTNEGSGLSEVQCKYCGAREYIWWAQHCSNPDGHAAWQNAAESLPAQPEPVNKVEVGLVGRPIRGRKCEVCGGVVEDRWAGDQMVLIHTATNKHWCDSKGLRRAR